MKIEFQNVPVSERLNQVVENSMEQIYTQQKQRRTKLWAIKGSVVAAACMLGILVCVNGPSIAAELPFIGHIFERMQESFGYKGDYSEVGEPLEDQTVGYELDNAEDVEEMENISEYTQTVNGVTVTLSEVYCNAQALYITMQMKSDEPLPETYNFYCSTLEQYSFIPTESSCLVDIEGKRIDNYTYAGVMRFDLNSRNIDDSAYLTELEKLEQEGKIDENSMDADTPLEYLEEVEIPETFTLDLCIKGISGDLMNAEPIDYGKTAEELQAMSEEEWEQYMNQYIAEHPDMFDHLSVTYEGDWNFSLDVKIDTSSTQVVELNDYNELGIGFEKVVKDRFEITMYDSYKDESQRTDYFPVMLDADGRLMEIGGNGGTVNTLAIGDRDVSKVDIFLIDYYEWLDELKGVYWNDINGLPEGGTEFKELLLERCAYHKEVVFEK